MATLSSAINTVYFNCFKDFVFV